MLATACQRSCIDAATTNHSCLSSTRSERTGERHPVWAAHLSWAVMTPRSGVPHWAPNQLRHLVGTKIRPEMGPEASQVVLGHVHADVTQIYAERNAELAKQAMERLG